MLYGVGNIKIKYNSDEPSSNKLKLELKTTRFNRNSVLNSIDVNFKEFPPITQNKKNIVINNNINDLTTDNKIKDNELNFLKQKTDIQDQQLEDAKQVIENLLNG
jgi:hypothetical protein